jgi:hypothetical protein
LNTVEGVSTMESNDFTTKQVVSRSDVSRNGDVHTTLSVQQPINSPSSISIAILVYLEPNIACTIVRLGQVNHHGALVGSLDDII